MSEYDGQPAYTEYHPRWYRPRVSTFWWLERRSYLIFVLRELSSVFVAWFVVFLLLLSLAAAGGSAAYQRFLAWSATPGMLLLNVVTLLFVVFHAVTWINLTPQAMVVRLGGRRAPRSAIAAGGYLAWAVVSALVVWVVL